MYNLDYVAIISIGMNQTHYLAVPAAGRDILELMEKIGALGEDVGLEFCSFETFEKLKHMEMLKNE